MKDMKEKKIGFNLIDLLILLFIIAAVIGIFWRYNLADRIYLNARGEEFRVEFFIHNIQEDSQKYLQKGECFYLKNESAELGTIEEILDVREAVQYYAGLNGELIRCELPGRIDVTGVMVCHGRTTREGVMINGNSFAACNKEHLVQTGKLLVNITIMSVEKVN